MQFVINNWYLFIALAVVLGLLVSGPLTQIIHGIKSVTAAQAVHLINRESGVVVDVCEPQEYKDGHIPQAVNIPLSGLKNNLKQLEKYKEKPIVVSCRSGNRSMRGAVILRKRGFATVYSLAGGLIGWQRDNLPVER
jgi:rhodanese-related sulfurtransferase